MDRASFLDGLSDVSPALPANATVGVLFGAAAAQVDIGPIEATAFSLLTVAARSQLAAVELLQQEATLGVVLVTIVLINIRYATFSAAIAPRVEHLSRPWRALIAYPLIDLTYTFADVRFADTDPEELHRGWYYAGLGIPWVGVYAAATLVGAVVGRGIDQSLQLQFMIPLVFISLLVSQVRTRPGVVAAVVAGVIAVLATGIPFNLGLLLAGVVGAIVGGIADARVVGWLP